MHPIEFSFRRKLADWICPDRVWQRELEAAKAEALRRETLTLLHKLWGKASSDTCVKSEWRRFQLLIEDAADLRVAEARDGGLRIPLTMLNQ